MFDTISKGFRAARQKLSGQATLSEEVIDAALKDVRLSLLEADVEFRVVKQFLNQVKEEALGETVKLTAKQGEQKLRVRPEDHFVQICNNALVDLMGPVDSSIVTAAQGPTGIMMVGLQGSGKTTTTGKLANRLKQEKPKVLLVAADVYRPAAIHQLQVLGEQLEIPVYSQQGGNPVDICAQALKQATEENIDYIIYDTAGRLAIDESLMTELDQIKSEVSPSNIFLVVDAMIGQEAVHTAKTFDDRISVSGVILTKLDGDARGGAALSIKAATGRPIKFLGMGEGLDKLEEFRPEGLASRILGMGDIVGLMQDFQSVVDEEQAMQDAEKMLGGSFTMDDFLTQIRTIQKMGSMRDIMDKMPIGAMFGGQVPDDVLEKAGDEGELNRVESIIQSMTRKERQQPELFLDDGSPRNRPRSRISRRKSRAPNKAKDFSNLRPSDFVSGRIERVAKGSGNKAEDVQGLIGRFMAMRQVFGMLGNVMGGSGGLMGRIPGMGKLKQLNAMRKLASNPQAMQGLLGGGGGIPGIPGGTGLPGGTGMLGGMGRLGGGIPGLNTPVGGPAGMPSKAKADAEKAKRKREKEAKRKNRRR